uniref:aminotransferase class V-fold PLP-dependent enzyme n=1 Tax=Salinigranum salinum TaxID=1364937 RepID=UPI001F0420DA|nr:aminotransferase class V-fold PLP-dependent enzyme [Salinigranum salinum]
MCTRVEWDESIAVDDVAAAVTDDTDVVTLVHNETSTRLLTPGTDICEVAREHDATFVVNGATERNVSSPGGSAHLGG